MGKKKQLNMIGDPDYNDGLVQPGLFGEDSLPRKTDPSSELEPEPARARSTDPATSHAAAAGANARPDRKGNAKLLLAEYAEPSTAREAAERAHEKHGGPEQESWRKMIYTIMPELEPHGVRTCTSSGKKAITYVIKEREARQRRLEARAERIRKYRDLIKKNAAFRMVVAFKKQEARKERERIAREIQGRGVKKPKSQPQTWLPYRAGIRELPNPFTSANRYSRGYPEDEGLCDCPYWMTEGLE